MKSSRKSSKPQAASAALIGFACFVAAVVALYFLNPAYDLVHSFEGNYDPGAYDFLVACTFFALGLASLALAIGLNQRFPRSAGTRVGLFLLGMWSLGIFLAGIFPAAEGGATLPHLTTVLIAGIFPVQVLASPETTFGFIHVLAVLAGQFGLTLAALVLSWRFRREEDWRSTFPFSLTLALAMAAGSIVFFPAILFGFHTEFYRPGWNFLTFAGLFWLFLIAIRLHLMVGKSPAIKDKG